MQNKQIEVDCPCCSTRLMVDVLTQTVVRAVSPQKLDEFGKPVVPSERWENARTNVETRTAGIDERMDAALKSEKNKASRLDDLFEKARDKLKRREEEQEDSQS